MSEETRLKCATQRAHLNGVETERQSSKTKVHNIT